MTGTLSVVQSGTPRSAVIPVQACQCRVLSVGTIGPLDAVRTADGVRPSRLGEADEAGLGPVQAVTRRGTRPTRGRIDIPP